MTKQDECEWCEKRLPSPAGSGRKRRFCSDSHRQQAYLARQNGRAAQAAVEAMRPHISSTAIEAALPDIRDALSTVMPDTSKMFADAISGVMPSFASILPDTSKMFADAFAQSMPLFEASLPDTSKMFGDDKMPAMLAGVLAESSLGSAFESVLHTATSEALASEVGSSMTDLFSAGSMGDSITRSVADLSGFTLPEMKFEALEQSLAALSSVALSTFDKSIGSVAVPKVPQLFADQLAMTARDDPFEPILKSLRSEMAAVGSIVDSIAVSPMMHLKIDDVLGLATRPDIGDLAASTLGMVAQAGKLDEFLPLMNTAHRVVDDALDDDGVDTGQTEIDVAPDQSIIDRVLLAIFVLWASQVLAPAIAASAAETVEQATEVFVQVVNVLRSVDNEPAIGGALKLIEIGSAMTGAVALVALAKKDRQDPPDGSVSS